MRVHLPVIFALQETRSWDMRSMSFLWNGFFMVEHFGLTTLVVSDRFCKTQRSWGSEERCTAVLFESVMVIGVYAPDSGKDL